MVARPQPTDAMSRMVRLEQAVKTLTSRVSSLPRIPVVLYPRWNSASQTGTAAAYATVAASGAVAMGTLWEGRIDLVSHSCLSIYGQWGDADATTSVIIYQLAVGVSGFTWQANGSTAAKHKFDLTGLLGQEDVQVALSVQSTGGATGTDHILAQPLSVYLREPPTDGIFG